MEKPNPIKRSNAFVPFSREHHFGLLLVWKIREDLLRKADAVHISDYIQAFFVDNFQEHLRDEEELIFIHLEVNDSLRKRAESEHDMIRHIVDLISQYRDDTALLSEFADVLEGHIRFEERVLFNRLQATLPPGQLEAISLNGKKNRHVSKAGNIFALEKVFE